MLNIKFIQTKLNSVKPEVMASMCVVKKNIKNIYFYLK